MILTVVAALNLVSAASPPAPIEETSALETLHLVRLELDEEGHGLAQLAAHGLDISHVYMGSAHDTGPGPRSAELVLDGQDLADLRREGWRAQVVTEDLQAFYAARLQNSSLASGPPAYGAWLTPPFASGAMSGYYGYTEIGPVLDQIHNAYPAIVGPKHSIGQTLEGREIWVIKVSDNPGVDEAEPELRFDALHHAREPEGMQTTLWFLLWLVEQHGLDPLATYLVDEREIFLIPCVNPDGYAYNQQVSPAGGGLWRKNRRNNGGGSFGVDLNRNYPFQWGIDNAGSSSDPNSEVYRGTGPASEPAVQAMTSFISSHSFQTVLTLHCYGNWWLAPLGYVAASPANQAQYDEVGALATEFNSYPYGPASILLYLANGTTLDYDHGVHGSLTWTPELGSGGDGFWPATNRIIPIAEENRMALARTALAAGQYLHLASADISPLIGDGDRDHEGGETVAVDVQVRNSGTGASGASQVEVIPLSPQLVVQNGLVALPSVAPFSSGSLSTTPSLRILPGTPVGDFPFAVRLTQGSLVETIEGKVTVGSTTTLYAFDFEVGGQGWGTGSPNNASTGIWTRVDPIGTGAQTEDDHTSGSGKTRCWVTGQGSLGGSIGENDVDGGTTSLYSPAFDLVGMDAAFVNYWRWYSANHSFGSPDDTFETDLSNDGGVSWTPIEVLGPTGPGTTGGWIATRFNPGEFMTLTNQMRVRFRASDLGGPSIVEAAIDDFSVEVLQDGDCPAPELFCSASINSVGPGVAIGTTGSTGVADGSFRLQANGIPPNHFGLFFFSQGQGSSPFGDGTLCLAPPFTRFLPMQADGNGHVDQAVGLNSPLDPGTSWNFQFLYRDPAGGPAGFNLSNAVNATFCP